MSRFRWAGNEPCFQEWPAVSFNSLADGFTMVENPVEGFPGMMWFPPGDTPFILKNVRVWPHPARPCVWLMEPLPPGVSDSRWHEMALTDDPAGTALYYRGWIKISLRENRFERCEPPQGATEESGQMLFGRGFAW